MHAPRNVVFYDPVVKAHYYGTPAEGDCFPLAVLHLLEENLCANDLREMTYSEIVSFVRNGTQNWRILLAYANGKMIASDDDDPDTVIEKYRKYWFSGRTYYQTAEILALSTALQRRIVIIDRGRVYDGHDSAQFNLAFPGNKTLRIRFSGDGRAGHYEPFLDEVR